MGEVKPRRKPDPLDVGPPQSRYVAADDDGPLSDDLERVRKLLFPGFSAEDGRARLRAVLKRADEERMLTDALYERLRPPVDDDAAPDASVARARDVFADLDDHTSDEVAEVVAWLEADPARADELFGSLLDAFRAGLRAGERL